MPIGRPAAQANWLGLKDGDHLLLFFIHQINETISRNGCAKTIASQTILCLLYYYYYYNYCTCRIADTDLKHDNDANNQMTVLTLRY